MSKTINDENQIGFDFDTGFSSEWTSKLHTINVDDFVGYNDTVDEKRIVIFDFLNKTAYVADEETVEEFELDTKKVKEEFSGLVVLKQSSKHEAILDIDDNEKLFEQAQKAFVSKQLESKKDSDEMKNNQKSLEAEIEDVEDNTVAKRRNLRLR